MERLTKCGYQFSLLNVLQGLTRYTEIDEILNQLAAYEDTGLSPADIPALTARAEAAEAERDRAIKQMCQFCKSLDKKAGIKPVCASDCEWRGQQAGREKNNA